MLILLILPIEDSILATQGLYIFEQYVFIYFLSTLSFSAKAGNVIFLQILSLVIFYTFWQELSVLVVLRNNYILGFVLTPHFSNAIIDQTMLVHSVNPKAGIALLLQYYSI